MLLHRLSLGLFLLSAISYGQIAQGEDLTDSFDEKHKACLERIAEDNELAYEEAMIWQDEGGGRRAKHCVAMALFALGHEDEAAFRLDNLAKAADGGSAAMRADFYAEAANFWMLADLPEKAINSTAEGLTLIENHRDLRIAHARALAMTGKYGAAEDHLNWVVTQNAAYAPALRYRADIYFKQGQLSAAKTDIESALRHDPTSVETALLRGHINEAIRKAALPKAGGAAE